MSPSTILSQYSSLSTHLMASPPSSNSSYNLGSSQLFSRQIQDILNHTHNTGLAPPVAVSMAPLPLYSLAPHLLVPPYSLVPSSQVPVVPQPRGHEFSIFNNSHPYQGEEIFNSTPQVENQSVGFHNSSGWSSGFT